MILCCFHHAFLFQSASELLHTFCIVSNMKYIIINTITQITQEKENV
ncbi:hypothetical protein VPHD480_0169 [Vibrio phage D480]